MASPFGQASTSEDCQFLNVFTPSHRTAGAGNPVMVWSFGAPFWPLFNGLTQPMQSLIPPAPQTETSFASTHNCLFWAALATA